MLIFMRNIRLFSFPLRRWASVLVFAFVFFLGPASVFAFTVDPSALPVTVCSTQWNKALVFEHPGDNGTYRVILYNGSYTADSDEILSITGGDCTTTSFGSLTPDSSAFATDWGTGNVPLSMLPGSLVEYSVETYNERTCDTVGFPSSCFFTGISYDNLTIYNGSYPDTSSVVSTISGSFFSNEISSSLIATDVWYRFRTAVDSYEYFEFPSAWSDELPSTIDDVRTCTSIVTEGSNVACYLNGGSAIGGTGFIGYGTGVFEDSYAQNDDSTSLGWQSSNTKFFVDELYDSLSPFSGNRFWVRFGYMGGSGVSYVYQFYCPSGGDSCTYVPAVSTSSLTSYILVQSPSTGSSLGEPYIPTFNGIYNYVEGTSEYVYDTLHYELINQNTLEEYVINEVDITTTPEDSFNIEPLGSLPVDSSFSFRAYFYNSTDSAIPRYYSNVIYFDTGTGGGLIGGVDANFYATCSSLDIFCHLKNVGIWMFSVRPSTLQAFSSLTLAESIPFVYFYDLGNLYDELFANEGNMDFDISIDTAIGNISLISASALSAVPFAGLVKTILSYMMYFFTAFLIYRIIRGVHAK